jgi:hypothetical protein
VEEVRSEGGTSARLFPLLTPGPKGGFGEAWSKWFGRYIRGLGIANRASVFHSFRHGFKDALRAAEVTDRTRRSRNHWSPIRCEADDQTVWHRYSGCCGVEGELSGPGSLPFDISTDEAGPRAGRTRTVPSATAGALKEAQHLRVYCDERYSVTLAA